MNAKATAKPTAGIELLRNSLGISPDQLFEAGVMPLSRSGIYDAVKRGEIESFRFGRRVVIPTRPLLRKLGVES